MARLLLLSAGMKTSGTLRVLLALSTGLALGGQRPQAATAWATADGPGPNKFVNHPMARDAASGPNGSFATGTWEGPMRSSTFSGFGLTLPTGEPGRVEVVLGLYLSDPVSSDRVSVMMTTSAGDIGPVLLSTTELNTHVGPGAAGQVRARFDLLHAFTRAELEGPLSVKVALRRQGGGESPFLHLDAVGLHVSAVPVPGIFDLRLADDPAVLAGQMPRLFDVTSPVTLAAADCLNPFSSMMVTDQFGQPVDLMVGLMPDGETVRVGFDDGQLVAPVDPLTSGLSAPAGPFAADGVQSARVRIDVRDAAGWGLGGRLDFQLDASTLAPAEMVGDLVDLGDGTYFLDLVALAPGDATIQVTVEGVTLAPATVSFSAP